MYTARNRRAATPPNITPRTAAPPAQSSRRPVFPADIVIPPHRGAVAQHFDLPRPAARPAECEAETSPPATKRPAAKPAQPRKVASKKERARKARLVRNKARAARKANASKPRKDKVAARIAATRPTGQPLVTPPVIALPQLPEPLVEYAAAPAPLAPSPHPSAAPQPLPRAPDGSRPADPPPAGRPSASRAALAIPRPPLVIQLTEWIDRRLREVWRAMGGQPPRRRRMTPRVRVAARPDAPERQPPPLPAEELARLRAENAALRRQLEALLALREPLTPA